MILKNPRNYQLILNDGDADEGSRPQATTAKKLSVFFAALCVIDLFGVFPIVTLPKSLISCGYYGLPLIILVFSLQTYTAVVLGRCWVIAEKLDPHIVAKSRYPYAAIADFTFGAGMKAFVTVLLDLTVFGAGIPNMLVASQNLQLLGLRVSSGAFDFSFCYFLLLIGLLLCPLMWLGSPKNMRFLATLSVCVCSSVAILTWLCIYRETQNPAVTPVELFDPKHPPLLNLLKAYGIISFQFDIHPMLLTIQVDMADKRKIGRAVFSGLLVTCTLSMVTTVLVYCTYDQSVSANVLESLPKSWTLYAIILLVTLQLCLSSAVGNSALFQHLEDVLGVPPTFNVGRVMVRSSLIWLAVLLGELIPKFDLVMGVIGGTLTGPLIFILPPVFYTKMLQLEAIHDDEVRLLADESCALKSRYGSCGRQSPAPTEASLLAAVTAKTKQIVRSECTLSLVVIVFGVCATLASTFYNARDFNSVQLWSPCLQNISLSYKMLSL